MLTTKRVRTFRTGVKRRSMMIKNKTKNRTDVVLRRFFRHERGSREEVKRQ